MTAKPCKPGTTVNVLAGFESGEDDNFEIYTDEELDACVPVEGGGSSESSVYTAEIVNANDYYPFGMLMPGRSYTGGGEYRYGFNGKENDNEVKGTGVQQDYGMRIYDTRLGKFLSVDPITTDYPELTPYQFASNTPIKAVDLDGLETSWRPFVSAPKNENTFGAESTGGARADVLKRAEMALPDHEAAALAKKAQVINFNKSREKTISPVKQQYKTDFQKWREDNRRRNLNVQNGLTEDGQKHWTTELSENETFQKFENNLVKPVFTAYTVASGVGAVRQIGLKLFSKAAAKEVLNPSEIHFMQSSIKNATGEFTVLGNAQALKSGALNPEVLRINVWRDATGKVWTLDHRRLAAFRLSGLQEAPIQWANPTGQMWKMTTTNGGSSIWLKFGGGNGATVR